MFGANLGKAFGLPQAHRHFSEGKERLCLNGKNNQTQNLGDTEKHIMN